MRQKGGKANWRKRREKEEYFFLNRKGVYKGKNGSPTRKNNGVKKGGAFHEVEIFFLRREGENQIFRRKSKEVTSSISQMRRMGERGKARKKKRCGILQGWEGSSSMIGENCPFLVGKKKFLQKKLRRSHREDQHEIQRERVRFSPVTRKKDCKCGKGRG